MTDPDTLSKIPIYGIARRTPGGPMALLGTGFALGGNRIATAYHVVAENTSELCVVLPQAKTFDDYQPIQPTMVQTVRAEVGAADPVRDLCVLHADLFVQPTFSVATSDLVRPDDEVIAVGYPHATNGRFVLTKQKTYVGARILIGDVVESKHIVLNIQARDGQSGSPVFNASAQSVVAMLMGSFGPRGGGGILLGGVDAATLHQTTHAISAEYLAAMT